MSEAPEAARDDAVAVNAKVVIVDPESLRVLWTNVPREASTLTALDAGSPALEEVVPMAGQLGIADAIRAVADSGAQRNLRADVISTRRGSMALLVSVYRLPQGSVLVVAENAWKSAERGGERPGR